MAYTVTVEFPRDLTESENARLTQVMLDFFRRIDFEANTPAHVCKKAHPFLNGAPVCHDCGRAMHRQEGNRPDGWCCPTVHRHPLKVDGNAAVECGWRP